MAGNSLGRIFRVTTAGESHGAAQVVIIDGVPAGLELGVDDLLPDLASALASVDPQANPA